MLPVNNLLSFSCFWNLIPHQIDPIEGGEGVGRRSQQSFPIWTHLDGIIVHFLAGVGGEGEGDDSPLGTWGMQVMVWCRLSAGLQLRRVPVPPTWAVTRESVPGHAQKPDSVPRCCWRRGASRASPGKGATAPSPCLTAGRSLPETLPPVVSPSSLRPSSSCGQGQGQGLMGSPKARGGGGSGVIQVPPSRSVRWDRKGVWHPLSTRLLQQR